METCYQRNRFSRLEYSRQYYQKHKAQILEYNRQYHQTYKKAIYESQKGNQEQWKIKSRMRVNEYKREWRRRQLEANRAKLNNNNDDDAQIAIKKSWILVFD